MEIALTVLSQVGIMFLLIFAGIVCYKKGMINEEAGAQMSEILLMLVTPAVLINAFQIEFDPKLAKGLLLSLLFALVTHVVGVVVSVVLIRKDPKSHQYNVERFAAVYGNAGFMGIPLIAAVLPDKGVFYASAFLAVFNFFIWTHGVAIISGKMSPKEILKVFKSPPIIGIILGLLMFLTSFKLPEVVGSTVGYIADLNTPLAMIVTGIYIARSNLLSAFIDKKIYIVSFARLIVIPLLLIVMFMFISPDGSNRTIVMANLLASACPTAATTLLVATKYRVGPEHASKIIAASTIFSILTLPLIMFILDKTMGLLA